MNRAIRVVSSRLITIVLVVAVFLFMYERVVKQELKGAHALVVGEHISHLQLMDYIVNDTFKEYQRTLLLVRNSNEVVDYLDQQNEATKGEAVNNFKRLIANRPYVMGLLLTTGDGELLVGAKRSKGGVDIDLEGLGALLPPLVPEDLYFVPLRSLLDNAQDFHKLSLFSIGVGKGIKLSMLISNEHLYNSIGDFIEDHPGEIGFGLADFQGRWIFKKDLLGSCFGNDVSQCLPELWQMILTEGSGERCFEEICYYFHSFAPLKDINPFYDEHPLYLVAIGAFDEEGLLSLSDSLLLRYPYLRWVFILVVASVSALISILTYFRRHDRERLNVSSLASDQASDGIAITDRFNALIYCNKHYQRFIGEKEKSLVFINGEPVSLAKIETSSFEGLVWATYGRYIVLSKLSVNTIRDKRGKTLYKIWLYTDIKESPPIEEVTPYILKLLAERLREPNLPPCSVVNLKITSEIDEEVVLQKALALVGSHEIVVNLSGGQFLCTIPTSKKLHLEGKMQTKVKFRAGVSSSAPNSNPKQLIEEATMALAVQQHNRQLGSLLYDANLSTYLKRYTQILKELPLAIERGEIEVHFQPVVTSAGPRIVAAEALSRWSHPQLGEVSPREFIPIVEQNGLERLLGVYVLEKVVALLRVLNAMGEKSLIISLNTAAAELLDKDFVPLLVSSLDAHNIAHGQLAIELTERTMLEDLETTNRTLRQLHDNGILVAIDDFGTGFSSLSYLHNFDIYRLKIDRTFIKDYPEKDDGTLLKAMVRMGREMGLQMIIEGVESEEQLELLKALKVTYYQGFIFSKALPVEGFLALLSETNG